MFQVKSVLFSFLQCINHDLVTSNHKPRSRIKAAHFSLLHNMLYYIIIIIKSVQTITAQKFHHNIINYLLFIYTISKMLALKCFLIRWRMKWKAFQLFK